MSVGDRVRCPGDFIGTLIEITGSTGWVRFPERGQINRTELYKLEMLERV